MQNGVPSVCVPNPATGQCMRPFHDSADVNLRATQPSNAQGDIDGSRMDGFIAQEEEAQHGCANPYNPSCAGTGPPNVMGYHDNHEIPNYWSYAQHFVLQDHLFEPNASWSLPAHLFMVSEWSARCSILNDSASCQNALESPAGSIVQPPGGAYAWTDLTYLLHWAGVSWKYYVSEGTQPDCDDDAMTCAAKPQKAGWASFFNPLPYFTTVARDGELGNIPDHDHFFADLRANNLPAVTWIVPNDDSSEHPGARERGPSIRDGSHQRGDAKSDLEFQRHLSHLG